jgi:hypothetical protein
VTNRDAVSRESTFPPYTPPAPPRSRFPSAGLIALIGLLFTVLTGAVVLGRRDQVIDNKVDRAELEQFKTSLEQRLGMMQGDIRVIRVCLENGACRRSEP